MKVKYYIGTCGWSYYSFKNFLYPPESKPKEWLTIYSQYFNTVEINVTFYKTPTARTFKKWYEETPKDFIFSVKAPKIITHLKKLKEVEDDLKTFLQTISPLKEKAKILLFQLPPSFKYNKDLFEKFFKILPSDYYNIIEIRNISFHNKEFIELLKNIKYVYVFQIVLVNILLGMKFKPVIIYIFECMVPKNFMFLIMKKKNFKNWQKKLSKGINLLWKN